MSVSICLPIFCGEVIPNWLDCQYVAPYFLRVSNVFSLQMGQNVNYLNFSMVLLGRLAPGFGSGRAVRTEAEEGGEGRRRGEAEEEEVGASGSGGARGRPGCKGGDGDAFSCHGTRMVFMQAHPCHFQIMSTRPIYRQLVFHKPVSTHCLCLKNCLHMGVVYEWVSSATSFGLFFVIHADNCLVHNGVHNCA